MSKVCFFIFIYFLSMCSIFSQKIVYSDIVKIENRKVYYRAFVEKDTLNKDISDLVLVENLMENPKIKNQLYIYKKVEDINIRVFLLENGFAKLRDTIGAKKEDINAQKKAERYARGIWEKKVEPTPKNEKPKPKQGNEPIIIKDEKSNLEWVLIILGVIIAAAGSYSGFAKIYQKLYVERNIKLLIMGEPSSGKTAMALNLVDPNISEETLRTISPTEAMKLLKGRTINSGRYELLPSFYDIAGTNPTRFWNELFDKQNIIIIMVSPLKNIQQTNTVSTKDIDKSFIDTQKGFINAFTSMLGAHPLKDKKPKLVILFMNKFDVFSAHSPGDSSSNQIKTDFKKLFKEIEEYAQKHCNSAKIPLEIIVGSSVKKWGINTVTQHIAEYLRK